MGISTPPSHIIITNNQKLDNNLSEDTSHGTPLIFDQETSTSRHPDKIKRRLAQNREAAKKSRLRKKAYVQQLETSRLKLIQLEQELDRARQQGFYVGNGIDTSTTTSLGFSENMNPGLYQEQGSILDKNQNLNVKIKTGFAAFEMEYGQWIEEQNKQICELRTVLQGHVGDVELRLLVAIAMKHYFDLFRMKSAAAKEDVFFVMSGMWRTSADRFRFRKPPWNFNTPLCSLWCLCKLWSMVMDKLRCRLQDIIVGVDSASIIFQSEEWWCSMENYLLSLLVFRDLLLLNTYSTDF
ncbi:transcription factor TGA1 [Brassica rapa]|uniref:transcription factor TGA1 n=1 Tax=Brassica campestris TaxID=3711 RepID=UPI0006AB5B5B|nr:transcription factor TGA1 [Brassica rapa]XP_033134816.1 transcription factor TGA1 [Brassica rapa]